MSKKDFIALADAIRDHNERTCHIGGTPFTASQLDALTVFCGRQNSNFKRQRWLDYISGQCGPNGGAK